MMHILADEGITRARDYFSPYGKLTLMPGREISRAVMSDVDVLLVRSVTRVDRQLLQGSPCRYVATATSGIDHIDIAYLEKQGIPFGWAKGCNADAVVDYVFSSLALLNGKNHLDWLTSPVGIIGCGEIGSRLARRLLGLGITPLIYDPFLSADHPLADCFASLAAVLNCPITSLHTPLTESGPWPTKYLIDADKLARLPGDSVLINACRGAVVDNRALFASMAEFPDRSIVLDAWEAEPGIDPVLLRKVSLGTPHIAGYSVAGKLNGTKWVHGDFCQRFGFDPDMAQTGKQLEQTLLQLPNTDNLLADLSSLILHAYNIENDYLAMLEEFSSTESPAASFDKLRQQYSVRPEFSDFLVETGKADPELQSAIRALGFKVTS